MARKEPRGKAPGAVAGMGKGRNGVRVSEEGKEGEGEQGLDKREVGGEEGEEHDVLEEEEEEVEEEDGEEGDGEGEEEEGEEGESDDEAEMERLREALRQAPWQGDDEEEEDEERGEEGEEQEEDEEEEGEEEEEEEEEDDEEEDEGEEDEEGEEGEEEENDDGAEEEGDDLARGANGGAAEESDSSEDERPSRNTIGGVPLEWYKKERHIGYDREGRRILKRSVTGEASGDRLDKFLQRTDDATSWRKVYDEYNDEEVELTAEEIDTIRRIREGRTPSAQVNPYEPYVDWFDFKDSIHPLSNAPEPKRRFVPSAWEAKAVVKIVRAMRKGWIKTREQKEREVREAHDKAGQVYLMWGDDLNAISRDAKDKWKNPNGLTFVPAPKPKLPGHEESYNPPQEYLPTEEEELAAEMHAREVEAAGAIPDRNTEFRPAKFGSLREVPAYGRYINERFERCLDLYLCPRARKHRIQIDPDSLLPKLPKRRDLQPFPHQLSLVYRGHAGPVNCLSVDPTGQWLASGGSDGTVRIFEVDTTRCLKVIRPPVSAEAEGAAAGSNKGAPKAHPVRGVEWCPAAGKPMLAFAYGRQLAVVVWDKGGTEEERGAARAVLKGGAGADAGGAPERDQETGVAWERWAGEGEGVVVSHSEEVREVSWHYKGDYLLAVSPKGVRRAVVVHQLSRRSSQCPFRRTAGSGVVAAASFHPSRPLLLVASRTHVRVFHLVKLQLVRKFIANLKHVTSMAVHPSGDHVLVGGDEGKVSWLDLDLSTTPYRTLRSHGGKEVAGVAYHERYPLFASCAEDGTAFVFHGMVFSDLMQNPLIVPLKILRRPEGRDAKGALKACAFHPSQPWLFVAGEGGYLALYCH